MLRRGRRGSSQSAVWEEALACLLEQRAPVPASATREGDWHTLPTGRRPGGRVPEGLLPSEERATWGHSLSQPASPLA